MESPALNAEEKKKFGDIRYVRAGKIEVMRSLQKLAVITGCLKIAKESIFAGTNNFSRQKFLSGLRIVLKNGIERNL